MDKNTTIAFILIVTILVFWLYLNSPEQPINPANKPQNKTIVITDSTKPKQEKVKVEEKTILPNEIKTPNGSNVYGKHFNFYDKQGEEITVENNLVKVIFSTKGGNILRYYLKKFNNWYSIGAENDENIESTKVQLINYKEGGSLNLSFISEDGKKINTSNLFFKNEENKTSYVITGTDSITIPFVYKIDEKHFIKKEFKFFGDKYNFNTSIKLYGMNRLISNNAYNLIWNNGLRFVEYNSVDEATYSDASVYSGGEKTTIDATTNGEVEDKEFNGSINWINIRNKYFTTIIIPETPTSVDGAYLRGSREQLPKNGEKEIYSAQLSVPFKNLDFEETNFTVYIGPVDYDILNKFDKDLEKIVDFGSFFGLKIIVRPIAEYILLPLFNFLHKFIPNYGFVIVIFSLIIKLVLYPLTKQSFQSMKKMQLLQPKITEIKEKLGDDKQKISKETMKLYSTYGVNPAGGCLPLLLQMPIFIALWGLFKSAIELRQQPFFGWITDLSSPDIIYTLSFKLPLIGINEISGLAILMGVTTFFQQKMSVKDPNQKAIVYIMPVFLTLMFMSFPSGLNLYYFLFNVLSIGQQYIINHKHDGTELVPVVKKGKGKSKGFMTRMMEAAEEKQKTQSKAKRKK
ncbi:MAG: preprotein translocase YidC [Ignavibacteriales bacterium CG_4_9_14_3_um_filter_30_11]|nr:MAG: preprotein translocase YidC [Ignavibacteriales bacterium CG_4_9_14_3_um_filter_30_11]